MSLRSALLLLLAVDVEVAASLKVAVFGATGRVGSLVVDQLLAADHMVTAVVRDEVKANSVLPNTAATHLLDLSEASETDICAACAGVDRVIWCASGFTADGESIDLRGMEALPQAFVHESEAGVAPTVVMLSSAGVTRTAWDTSKQQRLVGAADIPIIRLNPGGILDRKREAEEILRQSDVRHCIVRPTGLKFEGWPQGRPVVSQGDVAVGRTNPLDLAEMLVACLEAPEATDKTFEVFTLAGYPAPRSLSSLLAPLGSDSDGPMEEAAVDATYRAMQQLLPGEEQDATKLEMGRTYEQVDSGAVTARSRGAAPTERELALASNVAAPSSPGGKRQAVASFLKRLVSSQ